MSLWSCVEIIYQSNYRKSDTVLNIDIHEFDTSFRSLPNKYYANDLQYTNPSRPLTTKTYKFEIFYWKVLFYLIELSWSIILNYIWNLNQSAESSSNDHSSAKSAESSNDMPGKGAAKGGKGAANGGKGQGKGAAKGGHGKGGKGQVTPYRFRFNLNNIYF